MSRASLAGAEPDADARAPADCPDGLPPAIPHRAYIRLHDLLDNPADSDRHTERTAR